MRRGIISEILRDFIFQTLLIGLLLWALGAAR
ncbi:hypothetical protein SAMN05443639_109202 [Stigmatella erecta]|jgi:hypothetical protein|uniref:Uncharacterized protein n=1 Tax=Stigmatella erecta TaxID=83460 RepID=A0A1I0K813_9BACT|nr:hypothetical protein SAMN05443639_109202 [Stigmatella erecta]